MRAVDVRVRHDDDLVVARLVRIERAVALVVADAGADGGDHRADFLVREDLVDARLLGVDQLAAQRQDRLEAAVAALLGGTAGGVAFDDVEFGERGIAFGAVGELAGQAAAGERALAHRLAGLAGGLAGAGGVEALVDDALADRRVRSRRRTSASRRRPSAPCRRPRRWRAWSWSGPRNAARAP